MIGQEKNLDLLMNWRLHRALPRFLVIVGKTGSGRLTLAKTIGSLISCNPVIVGSGVDDVRQVIDSSYRVQDTTLYIFRDADDMRAEAKNALLKVTEEPPNNAYFVMTLNKAENTLETILNRSMQIYMAPYTEQELDVFYKGLSADERDKNMGSTPGELKQWVEDGNFNEFHQFVLDIADNLPTMYGTDVLQISNHLKCKPTQNGYDPIQFVEHLYKSVPVNKEIAWITNKCLNELRRSSLKKSSTIDLYLLELKELLSEN